MYLIEAFHYSKHMYLIEVFLNHLFNCNGKIFSKDKPVYRL